MLSKWLRVTLHLLYNCFWQSPVTNQQCACGTQTPHKIFIYISMMGFRHGFRTLTSLERLSGSMAATKAPSMSWKDKSWTGRLSIISPHPHLPFLWANILIYEEQVIDFHAGRPDRASSHLLYWYIRSTEPSGMKLEAARTSGSLAFLTPPPHSPKSC